MVMRIVAGLLALLLLAPLSFGTLESPHSAGRRVVVLGPAWPGAPEQSWKTREAEYRWRIFLLGLELSYQLECTRIGVLDGDLLSPDTLEGADLLFVFANDWHLGDEQRAALEAYLFAGKPVLVVGGAARVFADWEEFGWLVGANPLGSWEEHEPPTVWTPEAARAHPIVRGLEHAVFRGAAPLERVLPLIDTAEPLLLGTVEGVREAEPVAWTSGYQGGRIFVTSLGAPGDISTPEFERLLTNAIFWCLGEPVPEPAPQLGEGDSVALFDGETLEGWTTRGGRYDGSARWSVEEGAIVGRQGAEKAGGLLYTERQYRNFIVSLETRIDYPFDSGVFLRMVPPGGGKGQQVTLDFRPGGEVGAIYADGFLEHNPDGAERFRRDAWNEVVVRCVGRDAHVTAWLNGEVLVDYETPPGTAGFAEAGRIGLQVHGGEDAPETQRAMFRNVRLRELPDFDEALFAVDDHGFLSPTEAAAAAGWMSLFDGRSLHGWKALPAPEAYHVEDGLLVMRAGAGDGWLATERDYRDFELRLDFRLARMANSGLFLRGARDGGHPTSSGCEVQILDDFHWEEVTGTTLKPYQHTGGLYGVLGPAVGDAQRPLGEWNTYEVSYEGSRLAVRLNGHLLYDVDTLEVPADPPFAQRAATGFIGLQLHAPQQAGSGDFAWFRNLFVRELE